jgi:hypothetical protein
VTISSLFFTGSTLLQIPSDEQWYSAVYSLLSPYAQVLTIDNQNSELTIEVPNNPPNPVFTVNLLIDYVINCLSTPTPTVTPTVTPTSSVTPTFTPTNSATPTPSI